MISIYSVYTHLLFASLIIGLVLLGLLRKYRQNRMTLGILLLTLVTIGINGSMLLSMYSPNADWAIWWHSNVRLAIYPFIPAAGILFIHAFVSQTQRIDRRFLWILLVPFIITISSFTNQWHHLFIREYFMERHEVFIRTAWQPGILYWVHTVYSYAVSTALLGLLVLWFRQTGRLPRMRGIVMLSVAMLLIGSISLDTFGFYPASGILLLPISLGLINVILIFGVWYLNLLDILPIAREMLTRYMSDAVFVVDAHNMILDANPEGEKLIGQPTSEIIGQDILKFVLKAERVIRARAILNGEFRGILPLAMQDGDHFFDITVTNIYIESSAPAAKLIVLRDISELKKTEDALRESDKRYQLLAENIIDVIWILDLETQKFRYISPSVEQLRGFTAEEVLAQEMTEVLTASSLKKLQDNLPSSYAEFLQGHHKQYVDQLEQPCKDGSTVWTETTVQFVRNPDNNHIEAYGVSRNITERKWAEEKLQQLSRAVEQSPASIAITDTTGTIEYVNPRFVQITGYALDEVIGKNPRILKSGLTPPETYQQLWDSIRAGKEWQGEFINRKKNGELYTESAIISPITDSEGNITHYLAVKEDITKLKELQRQEREIAALEYRQRLARDLHDAVSQTLFSARLTSEMLLRQKMTIKPEVLWENIEHFAGLVKSALGEMRILLLELRPDGLTNAKLPILLSNLVDAAAGRTDAKIQLELPDQCELPQDVKIAFYRITQEALNNAIKHARSGTIKLTLYCQPEQHTQIIIQDNGQGLGQSENKGTQMGLNIMNERASEIGAMLEITSQPGKGTQVACTWHNQGTPQ